jgi:N-glycosylase/DNA lyase
MPELYQRSSQCDWEDLLLKIPGTRLFEHSKTAMSQNIVKMGGARMESKNRLYRVQVVAIGVRATMCFGSGQRRPLPLKVPLPSSGVLNVGV